MSADDLMLQDLRVTINRWWYRRWPLRRGRGVLRRLLRLPDPVRVPPTQRRAIVETALGFLVRVQDDGLYDSVYTWGTYEPDVSRRLIAVVQAGEHALDVGANVGWFSLCLAHHGAYVYAFEPLDSHVAALRENISLNGLAKRIEVVQTAVGAEPGTLVLYTFPGTSTDHATATRMGRTDCVATPCEITSLDAWVNRSGVGRVSLLKVDVEGHELEVFRGAAHLLGNESAPLVAFEVSPANLRDRRLGPEEVFGSLRDLGYDRFVRISGDRPTVVDEPLTDSVDVYLASRPGELADRLRLLDY
jgi:FkbM family methyltransferase